MSTRWSPLMQQIAFLLPLATNFKKPHFCSALLLTHFYSFFFLLELVQYWVSYAMFQTRSIWLTPTGSRTINITKNSCSDL